MPLKVLSYNIHKGFALGNRRFVLNRIREAIQTVHADLVFLQEVIGDHKHHSRRVAAWPTTSQFEYLADEVWPHFAYGKNAVYDAGHHGNAILSKYPFTQYENLNISTNKLEQRGMLHCVLNVPGQPYMLHTITLHLNLLKRGRLLQVENLCRRIEDTVPHDAPLIICGDFNDWTEDVTKILERRLDVVEAHYAMHDHHARTFPAILPMLKLDRIYFRGLHTVHAEALKGEPWRTLSDHAAMYAELDFPARIEAAH